jgi:hypothetical protein
MRTSHRIAPALALALLGLAGMPEIGRAQALIGGNGFQNGFAINGINNGFGGFNNGFGGFNNGFAGGFAPVAAVGGGGFGPMGFNNGGVAAFGFGGPMNGGMGMFYGNGVGFGGNFAGQGFGFNPMGAPMGPQAFAGNNLFGVAAVIDQQVVRRPGGALPAVRRRRR